jgi:hypothetical protein
MLLPHCTGSYLGWDTQLGYSTRATLLYSTGLDGLDGRKNLTCRKSSSYLMTNVSSGTQMESVAYEPVKPRSAL